MNGDAPTPDKVAGIIGSIDENKQTHISIERAIKDGMNEIKLFGNITDHNYFNQYVKPLLSNRIKMVGYAENKQAMYNTLSDVYLSSRSENASLVLDECKLTSTFFHGNDNIVDGELVTNMEVLSTWMKELNL